MDSLKNDLVNFMAEAEKLKELKSGEDKKQYTLIKIKSALGDDYDKYEPIISIIIDLLVSVINKQITIFKKKGWGNCLKP